MLVIVVILAGGFCVRKLAPELKAMLGTSLESGTVVAAGAPTDFLQEEHSFSAFVTSFRVGPTGSSATSSERRSSPAQDVCDTTTSVAAPRHMESRVEAPRKNDSERKQAPAEELVLNDASKRSDSEIQKPADPLEEFFQNAPRQLVSARNLFSEISRASDQTDRQKSLGELGNQIGALKQISALDELLPFWQLSSALEGLIKQIKDKPANVTPSTLRTAAAALDLLEPLCVRGLKPDLATEPPIRLLAVDDDPISRHAVCFALKKAFTQPDVANGGEPALALTDKQTYDVIFLDVEMPGMDGFELCSRIHAAGPNQPTPIVFVTSSSDFDSRAKSALTGGQDLIAKPFLTFEITVKALTLLLRGRLGSKPQMQKSVTTSANSNEEPKTPAPTCTMTEPPAKKENSEPSQPAATETAPVAIPFFGQARTQVKTLQERLDVLKKTEDETARQQKLGELCLSVQSLAHEADLAKLCSISRLSLALEGLLKKLRDRPQYFNASTLETAAASLDLLDDLCGRGLEPNLTTPPFRILVVDDDPVARRAISGALQLGFGRPENAETGEKAVAMAQEGAFDVIFLDVCMPGMDGFQACEKIRGTTANSGTPIVFVTSRNDLDSRTQADKAGGNGFIPKPVLPIEVNLQALTFGLRKRSQNA